MSSNLLGSAAPSFDDPIEMLDACHGRILAQLSTLHRLAAYISQHGVDDQGREAARGVVRYFSVAAPHHHADEEKDLFPVLLSMDASDIDETDKQLAQQLVASILQEHHVLDVMRDELLRRLGAIEAAKVGPFPDALPTDWLERFAALYQQHIELESRELLPLCRRTLSPQQLQDMGRKMAARRGASYPEKQ